MTMRKAMIAALLAVGTTVSLSALAGSYNTNWGVITRLESFGDDTYIAGLNVAPNPGGCANTDSARVDSRLSLAKKEGLARALTATFLAGRLVRIKLQSDYCEGGYPAIYGVWVQ